MGAKDVLCPFCIFPHSVFSRSSKMSHFQKWRNQGSQTWLLTCSKSQRPSGFEGGYCSHRILWPPPRRAQSGPVRRASLCLFVRGGAAVAPPVLGFCCSTKSMRSSTVLTEALEECFWINWSHGGKISFISCWLTWVLPFLQCSAQTPPPSWSHLQQPHPPPLNSSGNSCLYHSFGCWTHDLLVTVKKTEYVPSRLPAACSQEPCPILVCEARVLVWGLAHNGFSKTLTADSNLVSRPHTVLGLRYIYTGPKMESF